MLAQVPDLNDFVAGMASLLKPEGVITLEFPHLERLIAENQFDTIYHEHFSYFSLITIERLAARHRLKLIDVEELPTHGGSLRVISPMPASTRPITTTVPALLARERRLGFEDVATYASFGEQVKRTKRKLLSFLIQAKDAGQDHLRLRRSGQGQHAAELLRDRHRLPRVHRRPQPLQARPLHARACTSRSSRSRRSTRAKPDYVLILPWNLKDEIIQQMRHVADWGGKFIVPIPELAVIDPKELQP